MQVLTWLSQVMHRNGARARTISANTIQPHPKSLDIDTYSRTMEFLGGDNRLLGDFVSSLNRIRCAKMML